MKKVIVFGLFLLTFGLIESPPVEAGTTPIGSQCKFDDECMDPDPNSKCLNAKCDKPAGAGDGRCALVTVTCTDPNPNDCVKVECSPTSGTCENMSIPGCGPAADNCSDYITDSPPYECCKRGFNQAADPNKFKCCLENLSNKIDPGTSKKPTLCPSGEKCPECPRCPDCPRCPEAGRCPECPKPTPLNCDIFKDPGTKACCEKFKFLPAMVVGKCLKPGTPGGDCDLDVNIVAEAGATVNISNMNLCCQYLNNPGMMKDVTMQQACENITTPTPPPPGTPGTTTPAGSPAAQTAAECSCTPRETVGGTAFAGTPWDCEVKGGSSAVTGWLVTAGGEFSIVDPGGSGQTKSATLAGATMTFQAQGPLLTSMRGPATQAGTVTAYAKDLNGNDIGSDDCLVETKAEIFGGAGGESGGCSLIRNP